MVEAHLQLLVCSHYPLQTGHIIHSKFGHLILSVLLNGNVGQQSFQTPYLTLLFHPPVIAVKAEDNVTWKTF